MPFTFSHPAAVVPLLRVGLVPSALVIGSMAPDVPYYLPGSPISSAHTHSLLGVVAADLALGAILFVVWHALLAPAAVALAPTALRDRLAPDLPVPLRRHTAWLVLVSLAVGALTHVVWDAFTHPGRWGSERIGWLNEEHGPLLGTTWLQHGSGGLGLLVLLGVLARWWWRTPPQPGRQRVPALDRPTALRVIAAVLAAGALGGLAGLLTADGTLFGLLFRSFTWGCGAAAAAWVVLAAMVRTRAAPS
ncbi:DUF4184 family protein [Solirubrobacter deserti]|uniref:DUF4184 family protein n=1 Tax=Solirubrobacter deserti TaxID=2282478 RepID=A0ABT4RGK2_9ACTN|nr:DUF4184 family protein [Solirubrobacter deserti]MDA0137664.1 DUF4184 family protein [Solirubrobacter deserti]